MKLLQQVRKFTLTLFVTCLPAAVMAGGQGPKDIHFISNDVAVIVDTSYPGLVTVNMTNGATIDRYDMSNMTSEEALSPLTIATCSTCDFLFVAGHDHRSAKIQLPRSLPDLFSWDETTIEVVQHEDTELHDIKDVIVSSHGGHGYVVSHGGESIWQFSLHKLNDQSKMKQIFSSSADSEISYKPYGISFVDSMEKELLITTMEGHILKMDTEGSVSAEYHMKHSNCPGYDEETFVTRAARVHPLYKDTFLVVGHSNDVDNGVVYQMQFDAEKIKKWVSCDIVAGNVESDDYRRWVDGAKENVRFARPHAMTLDPIRPLLYVADTDNRALRVIHLTSGQTSSLMYNRDVQRREIGKKTFGAIRDCSLLDNSILSKAERSKTPEGTPSIVHFWPEKKLSSTEAQEFCQDLGGRLCEPIEVPTNNAESIWLNAECKSCYQPKAGEICPEDADTGMFENLDENYWNDGRAYFVGAEDTDGPALICPGTTSPANNDNNQENAAGDTDDVVVQSVACCWDCRGGSVATFTNSKFLSPLVLITIFGVACAVGLFISLERARCGFKPEAKYDDQFGDPIYLDEKQSRRPSKELLSSLV